MKKLLLLIMVCSWCVCSQVVAQILPEKSNVLMTTVGSRAAGGILMHEIGATSVAYVQDSGSIVCYKEKNVFTPFSISEAKILLGLSQTLNGHKVIKKLMATSGYRYGYLIGATSVAYILLDNDDVVIFAMKGLLLPFSKEQARNIMKKS